MAYESEKFASKVAGVRSKKIRRTLVLPGATIQAVFLKAISRGRGKCPDSGEVSGPFSLESSVQAIAGFRTVGYFWHPRVRFRVRFLHVCKLAPKPSSVFQLKS